MVAPRTAVQLLDNSLSKGDSRLAQRCCGLNTYCSRNPYGITPPLGRRCPTNTRSRDERPACGGRARYQGESRGSSDVLFGTSSSQLQIIPSVQSPLGLIPPTTFSLYLTSTLG